jgi:hypothetical protein
MLPCRTIRGFFHDGFFDEGFGRVFDGEDVRVGMYDC